MIDLHSHILPGLDDGAADLVASVEMARSAVAEGILVLAATPHVRGDYPTSAEAMEAALADVRRAVGEEALELELIGGGEIALERIQMLEPQELRRFSLGRSRHLLVEFPYRGWPLDIAERVFSLQVEGLTPVLAHPERNAEVQAQPQRLAPLVAAGALVQLTAASVDGRLGGRARTASFTLLELGLAHLVASDAHAPAIRGIGLRAAVDAIGDGTLARWLTHDVPAAIVSGAAIPARPAAVRRRRWWQRR